MPEKVIKLENVSYRYPRMSSWALEGINVEINKGELVAVMGENGAGKTTFCRCINGIIPNSQHGTLRGTVEVLSMNTKEYTTAAISNHVAMVLDDPESQLFTPFVYNEVAFGAENLNVPSECIPERISWALKLVGLGGYEDKPPTSLSGGEKQRLVIASCLAMMPEIMVLDEPTSQLDPKGTRDVFGVVQALKKDHNMTVVIATHKSEEIAEFADRVIVLNGGRVVAFDRPSIIFSDERLMDSCGIRPPQTSQLGFYMRESGQDVCTGSLSLNGIFDAINKWYWGNKA